MNFDLGPTLGEWMRACHPQVLARIIEGDRRAVERTGYGNAIMQSYHHTILPLASERDRQTELRWGIRWFEHTFGRRPRGIWLPETAVDLATLDACEAEGLAFTVLSPEQAESSVDSRSAYRVDLPSGAEFDVLFYEGPLSGTVSFNPAATNSALDFIHRFVLPHYDHGVDAELEDAIVVIASDGEVYGHHHRFKDYFLKDLLYVRAAESDLAVVSMEEYLAVSAARRSVRIKESSSWGCAHRLLRWRGDCDCTPGDGTWKRDLRAAFDRLAQWIDTETERCLAGHVDDVWALRDSYVDVVIGAVGADGWLRGHGLPADGDIASRVLTTMEAQRHRLAMYASCAFYWDDLTRIEAGYGVRSGMFAASLLDQAFGTDLQQRFAEILARIVGWKSERSAAELYTPVPVKA